ncbi:MAG: hypothetical protein IIC78_10540 [Chloroflexi bacterium]|nr:hypothetical protein [Chloroflexota bacterium]
MEEIQRSSMIREIAPRTKSVENELGTSERVVRFIIMSAFIAVLAFEAWMLWQVWQIL